MARPRTYDPTWVRTHLRVPPDLLERMVEIAARFEMTKDEFVVEVVRQYLAAYDKDHAQ